MEFFGVLCYDEILLQAPPFLVLSIGKRFVEGKTYDDHHDRLSRESKLTVLQSFFEALAGMTSKLQDQCFEALVSELSKSEGTIHVAERLCKGMLTRKLTRQTQYSAPS